MLVSTSAVMLDIEFVEFYLRKKIKCLSYQLIFHTFCIIMEIRDHRFTLNEQFKATTQNSFSPFVSTVQLATVAQVVLKY